MIIIKTSSDKKSVLEDIAKVLLKDKISFLKIADLIGSCLEKINFVASPKIEDYVETDLQTRSLAKRIVSNGSIFN